MRLLNGGNYEGAALILWGDKQFNPRPKSVKEIWKGIEENALVLFQGAGSMGKTLTPVCWLLLDWLRDPTYTNVKLISATLRHASSNAFSDMVRMYRRAIVKLPGHMTSNYIGLDDKEKKSGIQIIAIPIGEDGKGRLQGFHPHPREKPHATLGDSSRVRVFMDECIAIPKGVWQGIDNIKVSLSGKDTIKIIGSFNPTDPTSLTAQAAEPEGGWGSVDAERGYRGNNEWTSKEKWRVIRLDAAKSENVTTGRDIYPGLATRTGYRNLQAKEGGNSIDYWVYARGMFPPEGAVGVIIPSKLLGECRGEFVFTQSVPIKAGGDDVAIVNGGDNHILAVGRVGMASGFQPMNGKLVKFKEPRRVLQLDQELALRRGDTKIVGDAAWETALVMGIAPEYLTLDATGNGSGVHAYLRTKSPDVQGLDFNGAATNVKILEEDTRTPDELYDGVVSEVWFALRQWMEFGYFAISPGVKRDPLEGELTTRRYILGAGKKLKVESKRDYKKRLGGKSPDWADAVTILLHGVRMREGMMGSMVEEKPEERQYKPPQHDSHTEVEWLQDSGV